MNYRQRFYDSYDRSNYNYKVSNSYYHYKNIQNIIYRKSEYKPTINIKSQRYNIHIQPSDKFILSRQNKIYKKKLEDIRNTVVKPKMNVYYKLKEEKMREYKNASKNLEKKELKRENSRFHKRLRSQKSLLRLREMDQEYKLNHQKLLDNSKKINKRYMILPPINTIGKRYDTLGNNRKYSYNYIDKMKKTEPHHPLMKYNDLNIYF